MQFQRTTTTHARFLQTYRKGKYLLVMHLVANLSRPMLLLDTQKLLNGITVIVDTQQLQNLRLHS